MNTSRSWNYWMAFKSRQHKDVAKPDGRDEIEAGRTGGKGAKTISTDRNKTWDCRIWVKGLGMSIEPGCHRGMLFRMSVEKIMYRPEPRKLIWGGKVVTFLLLGQTQLVEGFNLAYSLNVQSIAAGRAWYWSKRQLPTLHLHSRRRELWTLNSELWTLVLCSLSSL